MQKGLITVMVAAVAVLQGCGETCTTTCNHVYAESECGVIKQGSTPADLIKTCTEECENALLHAGDMGDYEPYEHHFIDDGLTLDNETQAAAWIDCVWDTAPEPGHQNTCDNLNPASGICAPI